MADLASQMDEIKIICDIKQGQMEDFEELFIQYLPVIKGLRQQYTIRDYDWDDWLQEGRIVFYTSIINYDLNVNVSLGSYFKANFKNRLYTLLRFEMAYKRRALLNSQSIEDIENGLETVANQISKITPHHNLVIKEDYVEYQTQLSGFEQRVSELLFQGMSPSQIAADLQVPTIKVQNGLVRCKQKLSEQLYNG